MSDVTVEQLAQTVGAPVERLLKQMHEAGLPHQSEQEPVSEEQKQALLTFLKASHGGASEGAPKKITLKRKTVGTLKTGGGRSGRNVTVEIRRKRTYVKRSEAPETKAPVEADIDESELEAAKTVEPGQDAASVELPPKGSDTTEHPSTQEAATIDASETAEHAPEASGAPHSSMEDDSATRPSEPVSSTTEQTTSEQTASSKRRPPQGQAALEAQRIREQEAARQAAQGEAHREQAERREAEAQRKAEAERKAEEERIAVERAAQEAAIAKNRPARGKNDDAPQPEGAAKPGSERSRRGKEKERHKNDAPKDGKFRRRELSLKSDRRSKRSRGRAAPMHLEQKGGDFKPTEFIARDVEIPETITVGELAQRMSVKAGEVIKNLMSLGVMATINQVVDQETATLIVEEMGHKPKMIQSDAVEVALEESLQIEGDVKPRAPIVTVMGHVDHGKTSLLDYIRKTRVVSGEAGGITQHIGAYSVESGNGKITFIDTPGHAAFTAMRARGARVTDIVVLVVAADDGVMPQTEEAIQHAKAAEVPLIVAINKMDLEGADPERVTNELSAKDVVPEDWGGDTQFVKVSAITGEGIDVLLEAISLQAEILELSAVPDAPGRGVVVESRLDRGRGPVATLLVQNGTLQQGDIIIAGEHFGRVRAMLDDTGDQIKAAGPAVPIEMLGLSGTPDAGDEFSVVADERTARELVEFRRTRSQEQRVAQQQAAGLDNLFANLKEGEKRVLKLVVKADVRGSLEAILHALAEIGNDEVSVQVLGSGVGGITESDTSMALTYGAAMFGFNVRADNAAKSLVEREGIDLRYYSVIYELLDDVKQVLSGMLSPEVREEIVGIAEVRDVFRSPRYGAIAGCMVTEGSVYRNKPIRVLRDNVVIYEGELESLRRFKEDVSEVRSGTECGIGVRNYNDVRPGDQIEVYESTEVAREL